MRNVIDLQKALQEQYRVLKKGGRIVILDTTRPKKNILSPLIWLHLHFVIPTLGRLLTGSSDAYRYLPETTEGFVTAEEYGSPHGSRWIQENQLSNDLCLGQLPFTGGKNKTQTSLPFHVGG